MARVTTGPEPAALLRLDIRRAGAGFSLHIETAAGETLVLSATHDQLDMLADTIDDALLGDEADDQD